MTETLTDKISIITGASSGMGKAIAGKFAAAGSKVVLSARRKDLLEEFAKEIASAGGEAIVVPADVSDHSQVQALVGKTIDEFGRVDTLVNAAGFGKLGGFADSSVEDLDSQIDVNLKGTIYGCRAVLPHMIEQKSGHIINFGSIASVRHFPMFAAYTAAKWGVLGLSRSIYEEVREFGIRVNTLCPAAVNTEFLDVAGLSEPPWAADDMIQADDIAELAMTCVTLPPNVQIESMVLWPTCQATA